MIIDMSRLSKEELIEALSKAMKQISKLVDENRELKEKLNETKKDVIEIMKKYVFGLLVAAMVMSLCACNLETNRKEQPTDDTTVESTSHRKERRSKIKIRLFFMGITEISTTQREKNRISVTMKAAKKLFVSMLVTTFEE